MEYQICQRLSIFVLFLPHLTPEERHNYYPIQIHTKFRHQSHAVYFTMPRPRSKGCGAGTVKEKVMNQLLCLYKFLPSSPSVGTV